MGRNTVTLPNGKKVFVTDTEMILHAFFETMMDEIGHHNDERGLDEGDEGSRDHEVEMYHVDEMVQKVTSFLDTQAPGWEREVALRYLAGEWENNMYHWRHRGMPYEPTPEY